MVALHDGVRAVLVFLHGSGDTGAGLRHALAHVAGGHLVHRLRERGVELVTPSAEPRSYFLAPGQMSSVWFARRAARARELVRRAALTTPLGAALRPRARQV